MNIPFGPVNNTLLNQTCQQYVQGTINSNELIQYFSKNIFIISLLILFIVPNIFLLCIRSKNGKMDRTTFWIVYIISQLIAITILLLILTGILPANLALS